MDTHVENTIVAAAAAPTASVGSGADPALREGRAKPILSKNPLFKNIFSKFSQNPPFQEGMAKFSQNPIFDYLFYKIVRRPWPLLPTAWIRPCVGYSFSPHEPFATIFGRHCIKAV